MKQRCPHCQTTPLRNDAETCWYCGKDYVVKRKLPRASRNVARSAVSRRRSESNKASASAVG